MGIRQLLCVIGTFCALTTAAHSEQREVIFGGRFTVGEHAEDAFSDHPLIPIGSTFKGSFMLEMTTPNTAPISAWGAYVGAITNFTVTFQPPSSSGLASTTFNGSPADVYINNSSSQYVWDYWGTRTQVGEASTIVLSSSSGPTDYFDNVDLQLANPRSFPFAAISLFVYSAPSEPRVRLYFAQGRWDYMYFADSPMPGVPEPESVGMALAGLAIVGAAAMRRRAQKA